MELKRVITKRMRIRKNTPPKSIEMPPKNVGLDTPLMTPLSNNGAPATPITPGTEEFASFAFEDQPQQPASTQQPPQSTSPSHRSLRGSARSSRSASVASNLEVSPSFSNANVKATSNFMPTGSSPNTEVDQPGSPSSIRTEVDSDADEMAQQILDKVQQGDHKWAL